MQVVIDITKELYEHIKNDNVYYLEDGGVLYSIVKNGVALPKGHGRLIDETEADVLIAEGKDGNKAYFGTVNKDWEVIDFLKTVPTIIEADKSESEE